MKRYDQKNPTMKSFNKLLLSIFSLILIINVVSCSDDEEKIEDDENLPKDEQNTIDVSFIQPTDGASINIGEKIGVKVLVEPLDNLRYVKLYINDESIAYTDSEPFEFIWDTGDTESYPPGDYIIKVTAETHKNEEAAKSITVKLVVPSYSLTVNGSIKNRIDKSSLDDIIIKLKDQETSSINGGQFSLEALLNDGNYALSSSSNKNFIPLLYGFDFYEEMSAELDLYLYPKQENISKKPNSFIKGISLFDAGPWLEQDFYPNKFEETFDRLQNINANLVTVFDPMFVTEVGYNSIKLRTSAHSGYEWNMLSPSHYEYLTEKSRDKNMEFMWWFGVWPHEEIQTDNKSFYEIVYSGSALSDQFWNSWFDEYSRIIVEYAETAQQNNVTYLSLGHGLDYATTPTNFSSVDKYHTMWNQLISNIREVYDGNIVYFGHHRPFDAQNYDGGYEIEYYEDDSYTDTFIDLFDAFGITISNITEIKNPSVNEIKNATLDLFQRYSSFKKPLFLWLWAASVEDGVNRYGHLEPVLDVINNADNFKQDFYAQADVYEGFMQAVNETDIKLLGVISHGYMFNDRFKKHEVRNMNTAFEKAASIRGKPAEEILKYWFSNW